MSQRVSERASGGTRQGRYYGGKQNILLPRVMLLKFQDCPGQIRNTVILVEFINNSATYSILFHLTVGALDNLLQMFILIQSPGLISFDKIV